MNDLTGGRDSATKGLHAQSGVWQNTERISSTLHLYSYLASYSFMAVA